METGKLVKSHPADSNGIPVGPLGYWVSTTYALRTYLIDASLVSFGAFEVPDTASTHLETEMKRKRNSPFALCTHYYFIFNITDL